jgi:protein-S-isoprenylcysteine O-methyltransferase Ste14
MKSFKENTIRQIRIWALAAAVLPVTALAGIFFVWTFGTNTLFTRIMVVGETIMFSIAVIWWWWAMYTMRNLVEHWGETKLKVEDVLKDVRDIRSIVVETIKEDK